MSKNKDIRDKILNAILSDCDYKKRNGISIRKIYEDSKKHFDAQNYIDDIFIHLTGYTLKTLLDSNEDLK
jgi:hypothetical protein